MQHVRPLSLTHAIAAATARGLTWRLVAGVVDHTDAFVLTLITADTRAALMVDGRLPENARISVAAPRQSNEDSWDYAVTRATAQSTYSLRLIGRNGHKDIPLLSAALASLSEYGWTDEPPDQAEAVVDARALAEALAAADAK